MRVTRKSRFSDDLSSADSDVSEAEEAIKQVRAPRMNSSYGNLKKDFTHSAINTARSALPSFVLLDDGSSVG